MRSKRLCGLKFRRQPPIGPFIGVRVPVIRKVAREFRMIALSEVEAILHSEIHEEGFLDAHAGEMSRTMLRYAIERFPEQKRQTYLRSSAASKR